MCFFFFRAEDGIRDSSVTGVQTCALPIFRRLRQTPPSRGSSLVPDDCRSPGAGRRMAFPFLRRPVLGGLQPVLPPSRSPAPARGRTGAVLPLLPHPPPRPVPPHSNPSTHP